MNKIDITSLPWMLKYLAMTIFGSLISLTLVPILFPILFVFYIISMIVALITKIMFGSKTKKGTGTDVLSSKETEESRPIINIAFRFNGQLEIPKFRDTIWDMINDSLDKSGRKRYRRMMQTYEQVLGYSTWMDVDNFNIDDHFNIVNLEDLVNHGIQLELSYPESKIDYGRIEEMKNLIEDPENVDWPVLMKVFLNKHGSQPMRPGLPKWDIYLVKESDTRYSALFRFHHSIADGVYFSRMLCEGFLGSPSELAHSYVPPNNFVKWMKYIWSFALLPFGLWKIIKNNDKNVLHGPKLNGKKKHFLSKPLNLDQLRSIRTKTKASIHGILFSCLSYSIATHFKKRGENVPNVTALIPIPLQNLQKPIELKNKYAVASLKLPTPTSKKADSLSKPSLDRLLEVQKAIGEAKKDPTFLAVHSLITMACSVLPSQIANSMFSPKGCTTNFSTLPGPTKEVCLKEDVIEDLMFWIPDRDPLGVAVSILSYKDRIRVGLLIDDALLEDESEGEAFVNNFLLEAENALKEIENGKYESEEDKVEAAKLLKNIP